MSRKPQPRAAHHENALQARGKPTPRAEGHPRLEQTTHRPVTTLEPVGDLPDTPALLIQPDRIISHTGGRARLDTAEDLPGGAGAGPAGPAGRRGRRGPPRP